MTVEKVTIDDDCRQNKYRQMIVDKMTIDK